jgi:hypothetical protein
MSSEETFEQALQKYIIACAEWKLAITGYIRDVGQEAAWPKLEESMNRICGVDAVMLSPEEVAVRAKKAQQIVDANKVTPYNTPAFPVVEPATVFAEHPELLEWYQFSVNPSVENIHRMEMSKQPDGTHIWVYLRDVPDVVGYAVFSEDSQGKFVRKLQGHEKSL